MPCSVVLLLAVLAIFVRPWGWIVSLVIYLGYRAKRQQGGAGAGGAGGAYGRAQQFYEQRRAQARAAHEQNFFDALLTLMALMMRADGAVQKSELNTVKDFLAQVMPGNEQSQLDALHRLRSLLNDPSLSLTSAVYKIRGQMNHEQRVVVMQLLLQIAHADGEFSPPEVRVAANIAHGLGITVGEYRSLLAMFGHRADPNRAYTILGVEPDASEAEIKAAYRNAVKKNHPDRFASAGEAAVKAATEKFRAIQEAYEEIKKARGFS